MVSTWVVTQSPSWSLCITYPIILAGLLSIQPSEELASCTLEKNKTYATFWTERTCLKSFEMAFLDIDLLSAKRSDYSGLCIEDKLERHLKTAFTAIQSPLSWWLSLCKAHPTCVRKSRFSHSDLQICVYREI